MTRFTFRPDDGTNNMRPCGNCRVNPTTHMVSPAGLFSYARTCENEECVAAAITLLQGFGY